MRAVITVLGCDRVGIIAGVTAVLAASNTNILDISQTILSDIFNMIMIVDLSSSSSDHRELQEKLTQKGKELGVQIRMQREKVFRSMHRI
jgi:ACT domain-containing protein